MPEPYGDFPPVLYRLYQKEQYARALSEYGIIRLINMQYCTRIEDAIRQDATEGDGFIRFKTNEMISVHFDKNTFEQVGQSVGPGIMNFSSSSINPRFILCFSYPPDGTIDHLPKDFGKWVAIVHNPKQLASDIQNYLLKSEQLDFPLESVRIRYNKGELLEEQPPDDERHLLSYASKPKAFAHEYEYRFVVTLSMTNPPICPDAEYWELNLGHSLDYVEFRSI